MDKYITKFDTTSQLQSFSATTEFKMPHVSLTKNDGDIHYFYDPYASHNYVNIGGVRWATMNVGATAVTDTGLYFQWGDTSGYTAAQVGSGRGKKYFGWADYKYGNGTSSPGNTGMTKYNATDNMTVLRNEDNSAYAGFGGLWRMPTTEEFVALGNAVNTAWTASYQGSGVAGLVCTDKTDSSKVLFFPAAGYCLNGSVDDVGSDAAYWSSSLLSNNMQLAYGLFFDSGDTFWDSYDYRYGGFPVRPVMVFRRYFPDITVLPSAKTGLVYNGSAQILLSGGTASVPGSWSYTTGTNAGTYDATWTFTPTDDENYNVVTGTTSSTISKASRTLSWTSKPNSLDMGETGTLTATPSAGSGDGTITYTSSDTSIASINGSTITAQGVGTATITANITAGNNYLSATTSYTITCINPYIDGHKYVDLGLPSGTLWATMNVGATSETDYGNYYKYGSGATQYRADTSLSFYHGTENPLSMSVDTAKQVWGGQWHMPTSGQCKELTANTTFTWENNFNGSGVSGSKFTASNGNYVFFPAAGMWYYGSQDGVGNYVRYCSSTPYNTSNAYYFLSNNTPAAYVDWNSRSWGLPVRPVVG